MVYLPVIDAAFHRCSLFLSLLFISSISFCQNLLNNGDFEQGNSIGFSSNYGFIPAPTGNTSAGQYGIGTNPQPYNTSSFVSMGDHTSGNGNMMIVDGTNNSGNPEPFFWMVNNNGEICGLTTGVTYTFSYWIKSIYNPGIPGSSVAQVRIKWNNIQGGQFITPVSGSEFAPNPGAAWQKVTYQFIPTNACVRIEMFDQNGSFAGNDFAIDDFELIPPPEPLSISASLSNVTCPGANDGSIVAYGKGGIIPYTNYALGGSASQTNTTGIFTNLSPGTYTISVTDQNSQTVTLSSIVITQPSDLTAGADKTSVCSGDQVNLSASGGAGYSWSALPADPSLTQTNISNPVVRPTQTTTYTVTSNLNTTQQLIYNGNFSLGDKGFYTDYKYYATNSSGLQRAYGIVTNANNWFNGFATCTGNGGSGNMMVFDGSTINNDKVWCQKVPVKAGQTYTFSYFVQSLVATNPANLEVQINGILLTPLPNPQSAPSTNCTWQQRTYTWTSVATTLADICIYNRVTTSAGNDFALDDISFTTTLTCNLSKTVTVNVNNNTVPTFQTYGPLCEGTILIQPALPTTSNNGITGIWSPLALSANNPGNFTYTFTPKSGQCAVPYSFVLKVNPSFSLSPSTSANTNCSTPSNCNGTATVNVTGGTGSFTYQWNDPASQTTPTATGLCAGNYTVTVKDANNACTQTASITVTDNCCTTISSPSAVQTLCTGGDPSALTASTTAAGSNSISFVYFNTQQTGTAMYTGGTILGTVTPSGGTISYDAGILGNPGSLPNTAGLYFVYAILSSTPTDPACRPFAEFRLTVTAPAFPTFNPIAPICNGGTFTLPTTSTNGITGTWLPAINNTSTTNYTFTPATGQCAITAQMTITVNSQVTPTFTAVAAICSGGTLSGLPSTSNNGISGTWSPALNNTATTTYTFTPSTGFFYSCSGGIKALDGSSRFFRYATVFDWDCCLFSPGILEGPSYLVDGHYKIEYDCFGVGTVIESTGGYSVKYPVGSIYNDSFGFSSNPTYGSLITNPGCCNADGSKIFVELSGERYQYGDQCATTASMTITVNSQVTPTFTSVAAICSGGTVSGLSSTSNNGISGTWSPAIDNTQTTTYTFTPSAGQCARDTTMTVVVNQPVASIFTQIDTICRGGTITLPTISNNGITGTWSPAIDNTTTTTYTFTPAAGQCARDTTMTVAVKDPITPAFTQIDTICNGATLTLPTISMNGIQGTWSPAVNNTVTTTYTFTQDAGQCATTTTMTVAVRQKATPVFNAYGPFCQNAPITLPTLPAASNNGITGTWSPGSLSTAIAGNIPYTFTPASTECANPVTISVIVNPQLPSIFSQVQPVCSGETITLSTTSTNSISGTWLPAINNTTTTTYTFTPATGVCARDTSMTIVVNPIPAAPTAVISQQTNCTNSTGAIALSGLPSGNWVINPGNIAGSGNSYPINNIVPGTYSYGVRDGNGCTSPLSNSVTINAASVPPATPAATVTRQPDCVNTKGSITVSSPTGPNLLYSLNGGTPQSSLLFDNLDGGSYRIEVENTLTGCKSQPSVFYTINAAPLPSVPPFVGIAEEYCVRDRAVPVRALGQQQGQLQWYANATGGTGSAAAPTPSTATDGTITYYVTQRLPGFCESPRVPLTVIVHPLPLVDAGGDKEIVRGQRTKLDGTASGTGISVLWTPGIGLSDAKITTPVASPEQTTVYTLTVTSDEGCKSTDNMRIIVKEPRVVKIPNVISPNGDGIHDRWVIGNIEDYPDAEVQIFNRYGTQVYEVKGYDNLMAWEGKLNGSDLPVGAYYYIIRLNGTLNPIAGVISVIR